MDKKTQMKALWVHYSNFVHARTGAIVWLTSIVDDIIVQQASNMDHLCDLSYSLLSPPFLHSAGAHVPSHWYKGSITGARTFSSSCRVPGNNACVQSQGEWLTSSGWTLGGLSSTVK